MALPNFLILGAPKSATTSLYVYLREHPEVFMSRAKEPKFFLYDPGVPAPEYRFMMSVTSLAEYEALFAGAGGAKAIGEATPGYLADPSAPARIHKLIPDARLIAILRQPADRAYSHYLMWIRMGLEDAPTFEEAMRRDERGEPASDGRTRPYLLHGSYAQPLRRYFGLFPRERIHILLHEDMEADPLGCFAGVCRFLGVDPSFRPNIARRHNPTRMPRSRRLNRFLVAHAPPVKRALSRVLPAGYTDAFYNRIVDWNLSTRRIPPIDPATRRELTARLRPGIIELEQLIGRDLSHWLRERPGPAAATIE